MAVVTAMWQRRWKIRIILKIKLNKKNLATGQNDNIFLTHMLHIAAAVNKCTIFFLIWSFNLSVFVLYVKVA